MEGTVTRKRIGGRVVRDADVPHFRVDQTVDKLTVHDCAPSDSGADGEINTVSETSGSPPARFGQSGSIHVSIEADRNAKRPGEGSGEVCKLPPGFGRSGDMTPRGRSWIEVNRAKAADAESGKRTLRLEKMDAAPDRLIRRGGGDNGGDEVIGAGADSANKLGPTGFNCSKLFHAPDSLPHRHRIRR